MCVVHDCMYRSPDFFEQGPRGIGLPQGGKTGQVLVKKSDKDYDFEWKYIEDIINISEIRQKLEEYDKQPLFLFWDSDGNPDNDNDNNENNE